MGILIDASLRRVIAKPNNHKQYVLNVQGISTLGIKNPLSSYMVDVAV